MHVVVTVDSLPLPPFSGHNRVIFDWLHACAAHLELDLLVYGNRVDGDSLKQEWPQNNVRFHLMNRRDRLTAARAILSNLSIPTVSRNFLAEAALVTKLRKPNSRLLINFISGAPLLKRYHGSGVVLSGHDCMSHFFRQERNHTKKLKDWAVTILRERFAQNAETRYAHRAACVHVVSNLDAAEFKRVNPRVRTSVIPLGRGAPPQETIKTWTRRTHNIIWGSLETQPILSGVRAIFQIALRISPNLFAGWILIGRVPTSLVHELLPELNLLRVIYKERVQDLQSLLGDTKILLIPDLAGTGQKTRTLDGLASGCCVAGFPEAFRNISTVVEDESFVRVNSPDEMIERLKKITGVEAKSLGDRGQKLFHGSFSSNALYAKWFKLLVDVGPLS